jgi:co-chaperonin GroES (HSP10)
VYDLAKTKMSEEKKSTPQRPESGLDIQKPVSRHVMPLGPRVLVRLIRSTDRTATGLYLPPGSKDETASAAYGKVIEVARAQAGQTDDGFGANVSGVPEGANILFVKTRGLPVPWDEELRILDTKDVVAVVDEIDLEAAH